MKTSICSTAARKVSGTAGACTCLGGQIYHLMRGEVYTIEGKTVFAFGGAETKERQLYQTWGAGGARNSPPWRR